MSALLATKTEPRTTRASHRQSSSRSLWIARPSVDLIIGCGGWSLPLLALSYMLSGEAARQLSAAFYTLALVCNYPHYMATIYRAYGPRDRSDHRLYTVYGTAILLLLGLVAHVRLGLVPWLFTAYVMWSPWHYTGQNFGLLMMFLRRAGLDVTPAERRRMYIAFIGSYVMLLAMFNEGASTDPLVLSLGLPGVVAHAIAMGGALAFVAGGLAAWIPLARRASRGMLTAPALLYATQALWFVVPTAVAWVAGLAVPQTRYSSGILAVMHGAQYLWITQYFARRDQGDLWVRWRYWSLVIIGGLALFLPVPWLSSYVAHADFTASMLIVTAVVNLHHFMLDGVVWKLRDRRVAATLGTASAPSPAAEPQVIQRPRLLSNVGLAVVAVALLTLAGVDQWRYRLSSRATDPASLESALRLNPFDDAAQARLLKTLVANGRDDEARAHLDRLLERDPTNVNALVNAGVLARRAGQVNDAATLWTRALAKDPTLMPVQLYLAELCDEQGRTTDALEHYHAYLQLVVERQSRIHLAAGDVVPIMLKFGDALARAGRSQDARLQYDLALRMTQQAGLRDLEQAARQRLSSAQ